MGARQPDLGVVGNSEVSPRTAAPGAAITKKESRQEQVTRDARREGERAVVWTAAALIAVAPALVTLCWTLWRTPYPVNEAVALFEDVARWPSPAGIWIPETSYYRPLFHTTLWTIWHTAASLGTKLALIKLVHIVPLALLVVLLIWQLRPRRGLEAGAAALAAAVLIGSPGFRDNVEIPLSYTAVGMPIALLVWFLANGDRRWWSGPAIVALTVAAIGFKEQGLVLVAVIAAAWWTRAPGVSRNTVAALVAIVVAYVAFRLHWRAKWPLFEQSMGLGFVTLEPGDAAARFGSFPYWMYAYNSASTIANVLFSEPTSGVFYTVRDLAYGEIQPWRLFNLASSMALTGVIAWWGVRSWTSLAQTGVWSPDARAFVAMLAALLVCGVLSFNYSRDRLGGMAVVFYAWTAFFAVREAIARLMGASRARFIVGAVALLLLAGAWHTRAVGTIEWARHTSTSNQRRWLVQLGPRRVEFADRPVYLQIMESMVEQGTDPAAPRPTRYPRWLARALGQP